MESINLRTSSYQFFDALHTHNNQSRSELKKCVVPEGASSFQLEGEQVECLSKIKMPAPAMQNTQIQLCMRGHITNIDILNLSNTDQTIRLYPSEQGRTFLATERFGFARETEELSVLQRQLSTKRNLIEIPSSHQPQTALISTPQILGELQALKEVGRDNVLDGSWNMASATGKLAMSSVNLTLAAGHTGVTLMQCLLALGLSTRSNQTLQLSSGLARLAINSQTLGNASAQTGWDLANIGFHFAQTVFGAGQYTYASTHKPAPPHPARPPSISLVKRAYEEASLDISRPSTLTVQIGEHKTEDHKNEPKDILGTYETSLIDELGFEEVVLNEQSSQGSLPESDEKEMRPAAYAINSFLAESNPPPTAAKTTKISTDLTTLKETESIS